MLSHCLRLSQRNLTRKEMKFRLKMDQVQLVFSLISEATPNNGNGLVSVSEIMIWCFFRKIWNSMLLKLEHLQWDSGVRSEEQMQTTSSQKELSTVEKMVKVVPKEETMKQEAQVSTNVCIGRRTNHLVNGHSFLIFPDKTSSKPEESNIFLPVILTARFSLIHFILELKKSISEFKLQELHNQLILFQRVFTDFKKRMIERLKTILQKKEILFSHQLLNKDIWATGFISSQAFSTKEEQLTSKANHWKVKRKLNQQIYLPEKSRKIHGNQDSSQSVMIHLTRVELLHGSWEHMESRMPF